MDRAMKFRFDIEPMGAVRSTHMMVRHRNKTTPIQRYMDFKRAMEWMIRYQYKGQVSVAAIGIQKMTFHMPISKTERERKKIKPGDLHIKRPDIDNLIKSVADCMNGIVWKDDSQIVHIGEVRKVYSDNPGIEVEVVELI